MQRQTTFAKRSEVEHDWHIVDAEGKVLGRLATEIAVVLMGKHKPTYTPHVDTGDYVIVTNAEKVVLTGRKNQQKFMKSYSGYPGGLKHVPYSKIREKHPERMIERAVERMLPKSSMGAIMFRKLKVYAGTEHPHHAQQPKPLEVNC